MNRKLIVFTTATRTMIGFLLASGTCKKSFETGDPAGSIVLDQTFCLWIKCLEEICSLSDKIVESRFSDCEDECL